MILNIRECLDRYGSYYEISKEIASGRLVKVERGIYSDNKEYVSGESIVQKKFPESVFTMESAFLYHRLTDVVPNTYSLATPARTTAISDRRVKQYFVPEGTLDIGKMEMDVSGGGRALRAGVRDHVHRVPDRHAPEDRHGLSALRRRRT